MCDLQEVYWFCQVELRICGTPIRIICSCIDKNWVNFIINTIKISVTLSLTSKQSFALSIMEENIELNFGQCSWCFLLNFYLVLAKYPSCKFWYRSNSLEHLSSIGAIHIINWSRIGILRSVIKTTGFHKIVFFSIKLYSVFNNNQNHQ